MRDFEAAALAAIDETFSIAILYTGAGLTAEPLSAIKSDVAAEAFQGPGNTLRQVSFELPQADLPERPRKGNVIEEVDSGQSWKVNDITPRDDVAKWLLVVERNV